MRKILSFVLIFMMSAIFALSYADDYDFVYNKHEKFEDTVQVDVVDDELEVEYEAVYQAVYQKVYEKVTDEAIEGDFEIILDKAQIHAWLDGEVELDFETFITEKMHDNGNKKGLLKPKGNAKAKGKGKGLSNGSEYKAKGFRKFYESIKIDAINEIVNKNGNPMPGKFQYKYDRDEENNNLDFKELEQYILVTQEDGETFKQFIDADEDINIAVHLEFRVIFEAEIEDMKVAGWVGDIPFDEDFKAKRDWVVYFIYPEPEE